MSLRPGTVRAARPCRGQDRKGSGRNQVPGSLLLETDRPRRGRTGGRPRELQQERVLRVGRVPGCRQHSALPPFLTRPPAGGPPCPGFLGTDLPSLSFGELVGKCSVAVVTRDLHSLCFSLSLFLHPLLSVPLSPSLLCPSLLSLVVVVSVQLRGQVASLSLPRQRAARQSLSPVTWKAEQRPRVTNPSRAPCGPTDTPPGHAPSAGGWQAPSEQEQERERPVLSAGGQAPPSVLSLTSEPLHPHTSHQSHVPVHTGSRGLGGSPVSACASCPVLAPLCDAR